jgi:hypothetical protein
MPGGRPRKYDLIAEAKALDEWSKLEDSYSLYEFTDLKDYCAQDLSEMARDCDEFRECLKKAKERLGTHREKAVNKGTYNYGIWNRNARVYDNLLKSSEDQDSDRETERKKSIASSTPQTINIHVDPSLASGTKISTEKLSETNNSRA